MYRWSSYTENMVLTLAVDRKNETPEPDHDYPTMKESSAFIFHSSMNDCRDSAVGNTALHEMSSGGIVSNRERIMAGISFLLSTASHLEAGMDVKCQHFVSSALSRSNLTASRSTLPNE